MNILVTGAMGQLGSEIRDLSLEYPQHSFDFVDIQELNLCDKEALQHQMSSTSYDYLINCAAYTAVDAAETDEEKAFSVNALAVRNIGECTAEKGVKVIHVSTDYVFDGMSCIPYCEEDEAHPNTAYGRTKLAGESFLMTTNPNSVILRTAWLYSAYGNNFVKTMLRYGKERPELKVVFDQIGSPTYAADLAQMIMNVVEAETFVPGIYHYTNEGVCSWYDFTIAIHRFAGIETCTVLPIESKDYPAKTPRPFYSVLNKGKIKSTYRVQIPHWEDALMRCLKVLERK